MGFFTLLIFNIYNFQIVACFQAFVSSSFVLYDKFEIFVIEIEFVVGCHLCIQASRLFIIIIFFLFQFSPKLLR